MQRKIVVLPQPFGPIKATVPPDGTPNETSNAAATVP
jgi:hypothetical protein